MLKKKSKVQNQKLFKWIYIILIIIRFFSALYIFIDPIIALFLSFSLDMIDGSIAARGVLSIKQYQAIDKALDFFWYIISWIYSLLYLQQFAFLLTILFFYRSIGMIIYYTNKSRKTFFIFANYYENFLILILLGTFIKPLSFLIQDNYFYLFGIMAIIAKLIQEWIIHISKTSMAEKFLHIKTRWRQEKKKI